MKKERASGRNIGFPKSGKIKKDVGRSYFRCDKRRTDDFYMSGYCISSLLCAAGILYGSYDCEFGEDPSLSGKYFPGRI